MWTSERPPLEYTQTRVFWNPYTATCTRTHINVNAPWCCPWALYCCYRVVKTEWHTSQVVNVPLWLSDWCRASSLSHDWGQLSHGCSLLTVCYDRLIIVMLSVYSARVCLKSHSVISHTCYCRSLLVQAISNYYFYYFYNVVARHYVIDLFVCTRAIGMVIGVVPLLQRINF